jgi:hypothetical protein
VVVSAAETPCRGLAGWVVGASICCIRDNETVKGRSYLADDRVHKFLQSNCQRDTFKELHGGVTPAIPIRTPVRPDYTGCN